MTLSKTAVVDRDKCKGHGRCFMTAPEVFDCDDDGFAVVIGTADDDKAVATLERATANCPEQAITVVPAES
ncbi:MAG TPA: ferredoxin [Nocardioides sp.]